MGTEGDRLRVVAGRYRLQARIGRGGMGVVWRATDLLLGRQVAVKELPFDETLSAEEAAVQRERTVREARAVAQLRHPHIIVVYDIVEQDERPYIVMELIDGGSLADRIAACGPVDAAEGARIGIALLSALRTAHAAGVLHRDIKPANVLVESATGRIVLTDFGIARVAGATTLTEAGSFVGSPEYTAPERMAGVRTGPESDLWSLGALLCTALSGQSPFHRDSLGGILHAVVFDEIRPPPQAAPILPVVRGLLERDPDRRLTADEAEWMLRTFLASGRTPELPARCRPTWRDIPVPPRTARTALPDASQEPVRYSARSVLVAVLLVAATAGAGVSAAALLMRGGGDGGGTPVTSPPRTPVSTPAGTAPRPPVPSPSDASSATPVSTAPVTRPALPAPGGSTAPSDYRLVQDPAGFAVAVPDASTRES
ncbi:serine/threonine-protein kinase [Streptomyces thermoalcalitolerans]|uniref:non-specific serine/threonine protein kinase n=1 Tax=Streptomyces thermoalcalitolerans TaxID=65605 RepID=A0ABP3ZWT8_9ACTN